MGQKWPTAAAPGNSEANLAAQTTKIMYVRISCETNDVYTFYYIESKF